MPEWFMETNTEVYKHSRSYSKETNGENGQTAFNEMSEVFCREEKEFRLRQKGERHSRCINLYGQLHQ